MFDLYSMILATSSNYIVKVMQFLVESWNRFIKLCHSVAYLRYWGSEAVSPSYPASAVDGTVSWLGCCGGWWWASVVGGKVEMEIVESWRCCFKCHQIDMVKFWILWKKIQKGTHEDLEYWLAETLDTGVPDWHIASWQDNNSSFICAYGCF